MKSFFLRVSCPSVQTLVASTLAIAGFALTPAVSLAADTSGVNVNVSTETPCPSGEIRVGDDSKPPTVLTNGLPIPATKCIPDPKVCDDAKKEINDAQAKASAACSQAKLGSFSACLKKMQECIKTSTADGVEPDLMTQLMPMGSQVLSQFMGGQQIAFPEMNTKPVGTCPNMSSSDYRDQKERITREISSKNKEIADMKKEITDAAKDFNEESDRLQKDVNEASEKLDEKNLELSAQERETRQNQLQQEADTAARLRELNTTMLALRSKYGETDAAFMRKISSMTDTMFKSACLLKVGQERDKLQAAGMYNANGGGVGSFGRQAGKTKVLQEIFDLCLKDFQTQRQNAYSERVNALESLNLQITQTQESLDETNRSLQSLSANLQKSLEDITTAKSNAQKQQVAAAGAAQAALQKGYANMEQKQKDIAASQAATAAQISTLNQDLAKLGPEPASGSTNGWMDAQNALLEYRSKIISIPDVCKTEIKAASDSELKKLNEGLDGKARTRRSNGKK